MKRGIKFGIFKICLGLSLTWHLLGAAAIGVAPMPVAGTGQLSVPVLSFQRSVVLLNVGVDAQGRAITRPVTAYDDPEYFGFPHEVNFEPFQECARLTPHMPWMPEETTLGVASKSMVELSARMGDMPEILADVVEAPLQELDLVDLAAQVPEMTAGAPALRQNNWQLVLQDPSSAGRKCLVQILPKFKEGSAAQSRTLLLGQGKPPRTVEGLVVRVWVDSQGLVRTTMLVSSSGEESWDRMALEAAKQWRFDSGDGVKSLIFTLQCKD